MSVYLEQELRELGLSEKEARVYLASLELGPATVQGIAAKAGVNRPTTYVMIGSLAELGLMSQFQKGKKRYFSAESPEHFLSLIQEERVRVEKKESRVKGILNDLKGVMNFSAETPEVKYFEGTEGVNSLREEIIRSNAKKLDEIVPLDIVRKYVNAEAGPDDLRSNIRRQVEARTLYSTRQGHKVEKKAGKRDAREMPIDVAGKHCEVVIFGDKTAFFVFGSKPTGFLIESREVSETMTMLFESMWKISK